MKQEKISQQNRSETRFLAKHHHETLMMKHTK